MKKKSLIALLLACSFAFGAASMTGCNLLPGDDVGNDRTTGSTGGDTEQHEHTYSDTYTSAGASGHYKMATCEHTAEHTELEAHVYDNATDTTCNECSYVRTIGGDKEENTDPPKTVPVSSITLDLSAKTLEIGGTVQLNAQVNPTNATNGNLSWHSSDTAVATVDANGLVTAVAAGTANITAKSTDGSNITSQACVITVNAAAVPVKNYTVTFISNGNTVETKTVEENTVVTAPSNVTKNGYYLVGWFTGENSGDKFDFNQKITSNKTLYARWEQVSEALTYSYAGNECAAFEWGEANPAGAVVKYKLSTANEYQTVDSALVRASSTVGVARVDIVGLKKNSNYDFQITTSGNNVITVTGMAIAAYDRSGYAHFNYTSGVGAYNDDGTPKSNAVIVYVNEANKNTVKANGQTGIVNILKNAGTSKPLIVRVIGTVGAATWNELAETTKDKDGNYIPILPEQVKGKDGQSIVSKYVSDRTTRVNGEYKDSSGNYYHKGTSVDITQDKLISDGMNTLDESVYTKLNGLNSKIKYDASKDEFDSAWNDCSIQNVKNVTVEGIGEDARIFQWGMTFKNSSSIEVRNLTFEDYTEDACSFEGGNTSAANLDAFSYGNIWVHHNTFEEGMNYWDVCNEQDKHDGDGSTDFKGLKNITLSYNVYNGTHKTGLIGGSNSQTTANVTFHHNAYNACKSRLPLARQANMHMYNNYYNGTTSTDISLRAGAYALVENCYFSSTQSVNFDLQNDSTYGKGAAKVLGCTFAKKNVVKASGVTDAYFKENVARDVTITNDNKFSKTFDTDSNLFYYDAANKKTKVEVAMLTAEQVKTEVPKLAGVQKRNGAVGGGSTGGEEHQHTYADAYTSAGASGHYKMATCEHTAEHTAVEPHVYDNATDTTCNKCSYVRTIGGGSGTTETITTTAPAGTTAGNLNDFSNVAGKKEATVSAGNLSAYISDLDCVRVHDDATKTLSLTGSNEFKFESGVSVTFTAKASDVYLVLNMSTRSTAVIVTVGDGEAVTVDVSTNKTCYIRLTAGTVYVLSKAAGNNDIVNLNMLLPN